jgi:hypothetical protein
MTTRDAYIAAENGEEVPVYNEDDRREPRSTVTTLTGLTDEERDAMAEALLLGRLREPQHELPATPVFQPLMIVLDDDEDDEDDYEDEDYENYDDEYDEDEELDFEVYGDGGNGWVDEI